MLIAYFVATSIRENTKIAVQLLEILMNIPISGLSTYNKRFLLILSITTALGLFGNRRQELES